MADPDAPGVAVLVVDDETLVRMYATETMDDAGYQVYEARDGQEALTILEVRGDAIRALITDLAMPNLGGLDLAQIVSTRWPQIGIVFTSGYQPPGFRNEMPARARCLKLLFGRRQQPACLSPCTASQPCSRVRCTALADWRSRCPTRPSNCRVVPSPGSSARARDDAFAD
jgi:CheY-like chemotaxis protein